MSRVVAGVGYRSHHPSVVPVNDVYDDEETLFRDVAESKAPSVKDWCRPAAASMAKLNQVVQTRVYNMGFHSTLKPPKGIKKLAQQQRHLEGPAISSARSASSHTSADSGKTYKDLTTSPPLATSSYQITAWSSNPSVPESIAKYGKKPIRSMRPASANKASSSNTRPRSGGKMRPQSAKEPLVINTGHEERKPQNVVFGYTKNVNARPPLSGFNPNVVPNRPTSPPECDNAAPEAWGDAGTTSQQDSLGKAIEIQKSRGQEATVAPPSSVTSSLDDLDDVDDDDDSDIPPAPPRLRRPVVTPIHFSLPDVNKDNEEDKDELDTGRLLQEANDVVQRKDKDKQTEEDNDNSDENDTVINLSDISRDIPDMDKETRPVHDSSEGGLSAGFQPLETSEEVDPKPGRAAKGKQFRYQEPQTLIGEYESSKPAEKSPTNFVMPKDENFVCVPLDVSEDSNKKRVVKKRPRSAVIIREDHNTLQYITPRNKGRKSSAGKTRPKATEDGIEQNHSDLMKKQSQPEKVPVPKVELRYEFEDEADKDNNVTNNLSSDLKIQSRETYSSNSRSYADEVISSTVSGFLQKSKGEKNYYEMSRSSAQAENSTPTRIAESSTVGKKDTTISTPPNDNKKVVKTTKTIEFNKDCLQEIVSKNAISTQEIPRSRTPSQYTPILKPSSIKKQQEKAKMKKVANSEGGLAAHKQDFLGRTETMTESSEACLDDCQKLIEEAKTMAYKSLLDATRRPPSGQKKKKETPAITDDSAIHEEAVIQKPKRPVSASSKPSSKQAVQKPSDAGCSHTTKETGKNYSSYSNTKPRTTLKTRAKSAGSSRPPIILNTVKYQDEVNTPEYEECRDMQVKMAALGVDVDPRVLERALYPPSGKSLYYETPGVLPKNPSDNLISHYKYWLSEDYRRVQIMKRRLARDDFIKYKQRLAEEKKAKAKAEKAKKGGRKSKLLKKESVLPSVPPLMSSPEQ